MSVKTETKDKMRRIRARNKLRAEAHLPQLSATEELRKMNEHEVEMDFEAFVQQEYPKYKDFMRGATSLMIMLRSKRIREMIWEDFVKLRQK
jgi:hypothetical protein